MDEKKREEKKLLAGEKKPSMKRRDDYNDYRNRRMYMITLEVEGRRPVFGVLRGDPHAEPGSSEAPRIELTALGRAVSDEWMGIPRYYPQVEVMGLQMMPDHLHGILFVHEALPVHLGHVIGGFKAGCNRIVRTMRGVAAAAKPQPTQNEGQTAPSVSSQGAAPSSHVSPQAVALPQRPAFKPLFAPNYNDLILKNYDEFKHWKNYLADNPRRLLLKRCNPALLRPFFGLTVGPYVFSGVGNRALLQSPKRVSVRISRRLTDLQLNAEVERYLSMARQGAVLVSPAISPGEKRVMRTAFDAGLPTIVIMENGFTPLSKPRGEQFYACSEGRLLILSAWEHHDDRRPLTAVQCQQMNLMALAVCQNHVLTNQ